MARSRSASQPGRRTNIRARLWRLGRIRSHYFSIQDPARRPYQVEVFGSSGRFGTEILGLEEMERELWHQLGIYRVHHFSVSIGVPTFSDYWG